jgi:hypothetical protein
MQFPSTVLEQRQHVVDVGRVELVELRLVPDIGVAVAVALEPLLREVEAVLPATLLALVLGVGRGLGQEASRDAACGRRPPPGSRG